LFNKKRIFFWRRRVEQRQTSGGRFHSVRRVNVVFYQNGNAVQRAAQSSRFAFAV
jgi:hypothetical protein